MNLYNLERFSLKMRPTFDKVKINISGSRPKNIDFVHLDKSLNTVYVLEKWGYLYFSVVYIGT